MSAVAEAIERHYVTSAWVAEHYGVSRMAVHRAVRKGKLKAVKVRSAKRPTLLFNVRHLPAIFPS